MTDTPKLLPCPFCGGEAEVLHSWTDAGACTVSCKTQNCMGKNWEQDEQGGFSSEHRGAQKAIAAWNRRHDAAVSAARKEGMPPEVRSALVDAQELAHGLSFTKDRTMAQWAQRVEATIMMAWGKAK